jgi:hypothetical protein
VPCKRLVGLPFGGVYDVDDLRVLVPVLVLLKRSDSIRVRFFADCPGVRHLGKYVSA